MGLDARPERMSHRTERRVNRHEWTHDGTQVFLVLPRQDDGSNKGPEGSSGLRARWMTEQNSNEECGARRTAKADEGELLKGLNVVSIILGSRNFCVLTKNL